VSTPHFRSFPSLFAVALHCARTDPRRVRLTPDSRAFARHLRRSQTDAERRLWRYLRGRRLLGLRFRRQHPIGPYFADFACLELRLVVELDGGQHADPRGQEHDRVRTAALEARGYAVIRFWDNDVLRDTQAVLATIARRAGKLAGREAG
jgi:very-short-patch-repair endonuclease